MEPKRRGLPTVDCRFKFSEEFGQTVGKCKHLESHGTVDMQRARWTNSLRVIAIN